MHAPKTRADHVASPVLPRLACQAAAASGRLRRLGRLAQPAPRRLGADRVDKQQHRHDKGLEDSA